MEPNMNRIVSSQQAVYGGLYILFIEGLCGCLTGTIQFCVDYHIRR